MADVYAAEMSQNIPYSLAARPRSDELRPAMDATAERTIPAAGPSHIIPQKVNIAFAEMRMFVRGIVGWNWQTKAAIAAADTRVKIDERDDMDVAANAKTSADMAPSITISQSAFASNLKDLKV